MPAVSKKQQQFMALVAEGKVKKPGLSKRVAEEFASTKTKGLPRKVGKR